MRLEAHDKLGNPIISDITRVVIFDDFDNPVSLSIALDEGLVHTSRLGDEDMPLMLHMLGVNQTTIIDKVEVKK